MSERAQRTLEAATRGFRYLFLLNLGSKLLTFGANAYIVRHSAPEQQGARFNLDLWVNSVLFFSREAFRTAALRKDISDAVPPDEAAANLRSSLRVGWCASVFGAVLSAAAACVFLATSNQVGEWESLGDVSIPIVLHFVGAALEALAEPLYIAAQGMCLYKVRVNVEAAALTLKVGSTAVLLGAGYDALMCFGVAQLLYGLVTAAGFWATFAGPFASVRTPGQASLTPSWSLPADMREVLVQLQAEAAMRLILTEGEKFVLARWALLAAQGVYDVVAHLGSIVCRILFKFLEEAALATWSKLLAAGAVREAAAVLQVLTRLLLIVGLVFVCFGPCYSHALLLLLYRDKWVATEAPSLLSAYCLYIPIMGINGIAEAFYRAAATGRWLQLLWKVQTGFSVVYLFCCYLLSVQMSLGLYGLIYANCAVMLARICFCFVFTRSFFAEKGLQFDVRSWLPSAPVVAAAACGHLVGRWSEGSVYRGDGSSFNLVQHIAVGAAAFAGFAATLVLRERALARDFAKLLRTKRE